MAADAQDGWVRLGRLVAAERARRGLTVRELAQLGGIGVRTLQRIEAGRAANARPVTLTRLEDILGWQTGSAQAVLDGGEPKRTRDPQLERLAVLWPALTPRQRRALVAFVEEILAEP